MTVFDLVRTHPEIGERLIASFDSLPRAEKAQKEALMHSNGKRFGFDIREGTRDDN